MLTPRRQQQAIRDLMAGLQSNIDPQQLQDPYDYLYNVVIQSDNPYEDFLAVRREYEDLAGIIDDVLSLEPGQKSKWPNLAEIGPSLPVVKWLWNSWIPRGYLTLLAAAPGVGKSYFSLDLAHRLISGLDAPDGSQFNGIEKSEISVLYVDAEDFLPVLYQRVVSWGMDTTRFYPFQRPPRSIIDLADRKYQDELIDMVYDLRPELVIVDSLSRVNRRGENSIEEVREVLDIMVEIPQSFDCSLILVHHLRKKSSNTAGIPVTIHDIRGSGDLIAAARSVLALDALQTDHNGEANGPRRLKVLKTNLGPYPDALAINFRHLDHDPNYVQLEYNRAAIYEAPPKTKTDETADWLLQVLANGPVAYADLKDYLEDELGYNESILQRARRKLGQQIVDTVASHTPGNKWALAGEEDPETEEVVDEMEN